MFAMVKTVPDLFLVCCVLSADSARHTRKELLIAKSKHEIGQHEISLHGRGGPSSNKTRVQKKAVWDENWSSQFQHLQGKAAKHMQTSIKPPEGGSADNEDAQAWSEAFQLSDVVPAAKTTVLQMLGTKAPDDWAGLVLQGRVFVHMDSQSPIVLIQWKDSYTKSHCAKIFAGHKPDDSNESIYKRHCHSITGHGANHGIGAVLKEIITLGRVHCSMRAEQSGQISENHWFGVFSYTDKQRAIWLSENELCQITGENVLILPLESSEMDAYQIGVKQKPWAFPEELRHEAEDHKVHQVLSTLPTHTMVGRLMIRYECHRSDKDPVVTEISLLIQD